MYFSILPTPLLGPNHKTLLGCLQLFTLGASILQAPSLTKHSNLVNQTSSTEVLVHLEALGSYINIGKVLCIKSKYCP